MFIHNATTVSPSFLTPSLNPDGRLAQRAALVVLEGPNGSEQMKVFRPSTSAPDMYSVDSYDWVDGRWSRDGKRKVSVIPFPQDAVLKRIEGVDVYTRTPMSQEEHDRLLALMRARPVAVP